MKKFFLATITGVMFGAVMTTQVAGALLAQEAERKAWAAFDRLWSARQGGSNSAAA